MVLELLFLFVVWVTAFGLLILIPWAVIHTVAGAFETVEPKAYRPSVTIPKAATRPRVEDDSLLAETEV